MKKRSLQKLLYFIFIILSSILQGFKTTPLQEVLRTHPEIGYQKICDKIPFEIPPFAICPSMPHKGIFDELFILNIPNGIMKSYDGHVIVDNGFIQELVWGDNNLRLIPQNTLNIKSEDIIEIPGKVLVLSQIGSMNYCHWLLEILGRLTIIEENNIEYDWICVSDNRSFIIKMLTLWGIDTSKIINPIDQNFTIKADNLIVPSLVTRNDQGYKHFGNFVHPYTTIQTRNRFLKIAAEHDIDTSHLSKKVFISRKDNNNARKILNEDEIFALLKPLGFKAYILNDLSLIEQIKLFNNAEIVIGEHGAGMANVLFCNSTCKVIELFHHFIPIDFWYAASLAGATYIPVNTLDIDVEFFKDCQQNGHRLGAAFNAQVNIPLSKIQEIIKNIVNRS